MPYDPGYDEAGWWEDVRDAKWALIPVPFALAAFAAVIAVYRSEGDLGTGGLRSDAIAGRVAYGGLASLLTLLFAIVGVASALAVVRTRTHRTRLVAIVGALLSSAVLVAFVAFSVATA
jgi:hypothetical protein